MEVKYSVYINLWY